MINLDTTNEKAWQREIRERKEKEYHGISPTNADIKTAECRKITRDEASKIIYEYEWLGTMGKGMYNYGIFFDGILGGGVCFGTVASLTAGDMFGKENADKAICLERGACAWWAHEHSASKLISFATSDMAKNTKYRIFYAYSDDSAGEIGTVYQACNWLYLGRSASGGSQNKLLTPNGELRDSRGMMAYAKKYTDEEIPNRTIARQILHQNGWKDKKTKPKCKYCIVKGNKKEVKDIMKSLCKQTYPYPKRNSEVINKDVPLLCLGDCDRNIAVELFDELVRDISIKTVYCESNSVWEDCRDIMIDISCKTINTLEDVTNKKFNVICTTKEAQEQISPYKDNIQSMITYDFRVNPPKLWKRIK